MHWLDRHVFITAALDHGGRGLWRSRVMVLGGQAVGEQGKRGGVCDMGERQMSFF